MALSPKKMGHPNRKINFLFCAFDKYNSVISGKFSMVSLAVDGKFSTYFYIKYLNMEIVAINLILIDIFRLS